LIFYGYFFMKLFIFDPYFQYHPIRFFFPALSIFLTYRYLKNNSKFLYYGSFVIYSIAFLWNSDTGLVVFLSWLLVLLFSELFNEDRKKMMLNLLVHTAKGITIFCAVFLTYMIYMKFRYGAFPDLIKFFEYQSIFYKYGLAMIPMKAIHPWNAVVLIYIIGLIYGVNYLISNNMKERGKIVFFLSILGVGLFSYYQGRSHDYVLPAVWYPAIILLIIFVDDLWRVIRKQGKKDVVSIAVFTGLFYLFTSALASMIVSLPVLNATGPIAQLKPVETPVARAVDFIIRQMGDEEEAVILSFNAGVYHLMSKTSSPIKAPSVSELILKEDYARINNYILKRKPEKIFVDT
ncbi:hypothetical protein LCGC14_3086090, partial [marine sediment metagenome]